MASDFLLAALQSAGQLPDIAGAVVMAILALYPIFKLLAGEDSLKNVVNGNRKRYLILSFWYFLLACGFLRWETGTMDVIAWANVLSSPVLGRTMTINGMAALLAFAFFLVLLVLVLWCWWALPRDPKTFHGLGDTQSAVDYYTNRRKEGLDFVVVVKQAKKESNPDAIEVLAQAAFRQQMVPKLAELGMHHSVEEQIQNWSKWAEGIRQAYAVINDWQSGNSHGEHRGLRLCCVCGGVFLEYLRPPGHTHGFKYVFAATLERDQITDGTAQEDFGLIVAALRHIENGVGA